MTSWNIDIDRITVRGVRGGRLDAAELGALVDRAIRDSLARATLAPGRSARSSVQLTVPALTKAADVARAVATGVATASRRRANG